MIGKLACTSCVFWQHRPEIKNPLNHRTGSCRRHAPGVFPQPETGKPISRWPLTNEYDACGDHAASIERAA